MVEAVKGVNGGHCVLAKPNGSLTGQHNGGREHPIVGPYLALDIATLRQMSPIFTFFVHFLVLWCPMNLILYLPIQRTYKSSRNSNIFLVFVATQTARTFARWMTWSRISCCHFLEIADTGRHPSALSPVLCRPETPC